MIASFRAENLKARKRWANWILFGILMALVIAFGYVIPYLVFSHPPPNFQSRIPASVLKRETFPENLLPNVLSGQTTLGAAIMVILGALSTASEYGWLTVQTILLQKPGRLAVLLGKQLNLLIVTVLISVIALGAAALTSFLLVTIDGTSSQWPSTEMLLKGFGALALQLAVWMAFGMFLGVVLRSTAGAIGAGLTYLFVVETILGRLLRDTGGIKEVLKLLPGVNASAVNAAFPLTIQNPSEVSELVSAERGVITLAVSLVLFVILSLLLFRARDVTGG